MLCFFNEQLSIISKAANGVVLRNLCSRWVFALFPGVVKKFKIDLPSRKAEILLCS